jgi:hypothetical protein
MWVSIAGYHLVSAARLVLVDHRGPLGVVAHTRHQITQARAAVGRELRILVAWGTMKLDDPVGPAWTRSMPLSSKR